MDIGFEKELKSEFYARELYMQSCLRYCSGCDIKMSCISSNFSSFFLDSLNDPSEFAKYLSNSENKTQTPDDQIYATPTGTNGNALSLASINNDIGSYPSNYASSCQQDHHCLNDCCQTVFYQPKQQTTPQASERQLNQNPHLVASQQITSQPYSHSSADSNIIIANRTSQTPQNTEFENMFDISKFISHTGYGSHEVTAVENSTSFQNQLMDLDNSSLAIPGRTASSSNSLDVDTFDHDSKSLYDIHNSNESVFSDQRISSNTSECSDSSNQANHPKPLTKFVIKENFEVHSAHKVEEGIFQHMNKLPVKKKDTLKTLGVTFTGHMSVMDKAIIVDNFANFCEEYGVLDHRPFLTLNQSGMQKPEQIKFARYLGRGLPKFTLFCIYSNFKNMFCIKRFENYTKGSYNLQYILEKTKKFLTCTSAETPTSIVSPSANGNNSVEQKISKTLESFTILENFDVHASHRIEDGIFTHIGRLSPKKQELLKQFGIQSNHNVTYSEKCTIIENFIKFSREYSIEDHRPLLDFHESGLPKLEQIKFARYLGQGLPNLTLYKIYSAFKDMLALNRLEKLTAEGYNLETILKKKRKNLINRLNAAKRSVKDSTDSISHQHANQCQNLETS